MERKKEFSVFSFQVFNSGLISHSRHFLLDLVRSDFFALEKQEEGLQIFAEERITY